MTKNPSGASHYNPKSASADLCELQNAVVIPLAPSSNPNNVKGGVKSSRLDEKFLQCRWSAVHSSKASLETVTDLTYIQQWSGKLSHQKGRYLFGGPIFKNFGHFLAESIHRTWAYETQEKKNNVNYRGVILLPQNTKKLNFIQRLNYKLPPIFKETLHYLGIPKSKIKLLFSAKSFESLDIPQQASHFRSPVPINDSYKSYLLRCEKRNGIVSNVHNHKKVYVSRTHFSLRGAFAGESTLEALLKRNGFHIFYPEQHTLLQQLQTYKGAEEIVFAEGGALHVLELLGELSADIYIIARRPKSPAVFNAMLEARVTKFMFFTAVITLPSLFVPKRSNRTAHGSAISLLNYNELFEFLSKELQIKVNISDIEEFKKATRRDVDLYYAHYKTLIPGDESVKAKAIQNFITQLRSLPDFLEHQFNN